MYTILSSARIALFMVRVGKEINQRMGTFCALVEWTGDIMYIFVKGMYVYVCL